MLFPDYFFSCDYDGQYYFALSPDQAIKEQVEKKIE